MADNADEFDASDVRTPPPTFEALALYVAHNREDLRKVERAFDRFRFQCEQDIRDIFALLAELRKSK